MMVREPAVAGAFYPASQPRCRQQLGDLVPTDLDVRDLPERIVGGIAPHAGWMFSGRVAGTVFAAIAARGKPATVVMFGAPHRQLARPALMFADGAWETPLGLARVDERLAERVLGCTSLIEADPYAHEAEHSIEVQVPFVQHLFPEARILPILVEPAAQAVEVGQAVARAVEGSTAQTVYVGSTDLTHYGPRYGITPAGLGEAGLRWAKEVNDKRIIDLTLRMEAEAIVPEVRRHHNACGSGAVAATLAACKVAGAQRGVLLAHVSSYEVARELGSDPGGDAVGYAAIVFG